MNEWGSLALLIVQLIGYAITVIYFVRATRTGFETKLKAQYDLVGKVDDLVASINTLKELHERERADILEQTKEDRKYSHRTRDMVTMMRIQHKMNHDQDIIGGD